MAKKERIIYGQLESELDIPALPLKSMGIISLIMAIVTVIVLCFTFFNIDRVKTYNYLDDRYRYSNPYTRYINQTVVPFKTYNQYGSSADLDYDIRTVGLKYHSNILDTDIYTNYDWPYYFIIESEYFFVSYRIDNSYYMDYLSKQLENNMNYIDIPFQYLDISIFCGKEANGDSIDFYLLKDRFLLDYNVHDLMNPSSVETTNWQIEEILVFDNGVLDLESNNIIGVSDATIKAVVNDDIISYLRNSNLKFALRTDRYFLTSVGMSANVPAHYSFINFWDVIDVSSFDFAGLASDMNYGFTQIGEAPVLPDPDNYSTDIGYVAAYFQWVVDEIIYLFKVVSVPLKEVLI